MSTTFTDFCNEVYQTVDNQNLRSLPYIKAATVRYLSELSQHRMTLLESTFQFALTTGVQQYDAATTGFPADAQEFDNVWTANTADATGTRREVEGPVQIAEISLAASNVHQSSPLKYAFHDGRIWLGPAPPAGYVLGGEYLRDGTKDSATGALITVDSTTHTNPWFGRGKHALLNKVLADVYATQMKDFQVAGAFDAIAGESLQGLRNEHARRSTSHYQVRASFGGWTW